MFSVLTILAVIIGIVLIVLVLLQPGKGDLSATFGGISGQFGSMFGMQRTADFLNKLTRVLAIVVLVLILVANRLILGGVKTEKIKPVTEGAKPPIGNTMTPPPVEAPKK